MANFKSQVEAVRSKVKDLEYALAVQRGVLENLEKIEQESEVEPGPRHSGSGRKGDRVALTPPVIRGSVADAAAEVLKEKGAPLRASRIARLLAHRGVVPPGRTEMLPLVLSALRRRKDIFKRVSRGVYGLVADAKVGDQQG